MHACRCAIQAEASTKRHAGVHSVQAPAACGMQTRHHPPSPYPAGQIRISHAPLPPHRSTSPIVMTVPAALTPAVSSNRNGKLWTHGCLVKLHSFYSLLLHSLLPHSYHPIPYSSIPYSPTPYVSTPCPPTPYSPIPTPPFRTRLFLKPPLLTWLLLAARLSVS